MEILILGGYGNLGKEILNLLVHHTTHNVTILGKNFDKLNQIASSHNRKILCIATNLEDFYDFKNYDLVINATSCIHFQNELVSRIAQADCDFFDCHQPCKINYDLLEKYKQTSKTFLFDCGATTFLPFLHLTNPVNDLYVVSYFKTCWEDRNVSQLSIDEFNYINKNNKTEYCTFIDNTWYNYHQSSKKLFNIGQIDPMFNGEIKCAKELIPSLTNAGYYFKMEAVDAKKLERSSISIYSDSITVEVSTNCGYVMSAAMIVAAILEHQHVPKQGSYLMGNYVHAITFVKNLQNLGISIKLN